MRNMLILLVLVFLNIGYWIQLIKSIKMYIGLERGNSTRNICILLATVALCIYFIMNTGFIFSKETVGSKLFGSLLMTCGAYLLVQLANVIYANRG